MNNYPKIVLATDFTEAADHAVDYTIRLFSSLPNIKPQYFLLHGFKPLVPYSHTPSIPVITNESRETELKKKLETQREILQEAENVDAYFVRGAIQEAINKLKLTEKPNLIVMGSRKKDTYARMTIGAHTVNVVKEATCPVLAVPIEADFTSIRKIALLVLDDKEPTAESIAFLKNISAQHESKISVLYVSEKEGLEAINTKVHARMDGLNHDHVVLDDHDSYDEIAEEVEKIDPDLLALICDDAGFFEKIFHNSISEKMIYGSRVPTLILKNL